MTKDLKDHYKTTHSQLEVFRPCFQTKPTSLSVYAFIPLLLKPFSWRVLQLSLSVSTLSKKPDAPFSTFFRDSSEDSMQYMEVVSDILVPLIVC